MSVPPRLIKEMIASSTVWCWVLVGFALVNLTAWVLEMVAALTGYWSWVAAHDSLVLSGIGFIILVIVLAVHLLCLRILKRLLHDG